MEFLNEYQLSGLLKRGKSVEAFVGKYEEASYPTIMWLSIEKGRESKELFYVILHYVFDDRQDGVESIYNFSYVQPDELYGKIVAKFVSCSEAIQFAREKYRVENFNGEGGMDELI